MNWLHLYPSMLVCIIVAAGFYFRINEKSTATAKPLDKRCDLWANVSLYPDVDWRKLLCCSSSSSNFSKSLIRLLTMMVATRRKCNRILLLHVKNLSIRVFFGFIIIFTLVFLLTDSIGSSNAPADYSSKKTVYYRSSYLNQSST